MLPIKSSAVKAQYCINSLEANLIETDNIKVVSIRRNDLGGGTVK